RNPDDFRGRRIVGAAVFWAMLRKEFVEHVLTKVRRAQHAAVGERSLHKEGQPDQVFQRRAEFLQIGLYVGEYVVPLCRRVADGSAALLEWIIIVGGRGISGQEDKPFGSGDHRTLAPWHLTAALELLVRHELQFFLPWLAAKAGGQRQSVISVA